MLVDLLARYRHKIKTPGELVDIIGLRPRKRRVIMCHGVFDVVHPGHVRHLLYAKSKADVLIASITADQHVTKGAHRPHVPQDLRAMNLAAFEAVDYVVIDHNPKPFENIRFIQPDYFAKGFEYTGAAEEVDVVQAYGGETLFTPGDIVYSSSKLIELAPPNIRQEKLLALMERAGVGFGDLYAAIDRMPDKHVHVVGDTIVDTITYGHVLGASGKTPTMSVHIERSESFVGGAAVVAKHIAASGATVAFSTVLGNDSNGQLVADDLSAIDLHHSVDLMRPTTNKNVIVAGGYRLLKLDTADNSPISDRCAAEIQDNSVSLETDAVVFSDFRHGIFNRRSIPGLVGSVQGFKAADSQVASRWGNILDFRGFDLITPNEREARFATGDQDSGLRDLAWSLYEAAKCKFLILKLGERGVMVKAGGDSFVLDSFADNIIDPVGAGDALLAYATLGMLTTGSPVVSTILGTFAAGVACEHDGNVPVSADDLRTKIDTAEGL